MSASLKVRPANTFGGGYPPRTPPFSSAARQVLIARKVKKNVTADENERGERGGTPRQPLSLCCFKIIASLSFFLLPPRSTAADISLRSVRQCGLTEYGHTVLCRLRLLRDRRGGGPLPEPSRLRDFRFCGHVQGGSEYTAFFTTMQNRISQATKTAIAPPGRPTHPPRKTGEGTARSTERHCLPAGLTAGVPADPSTRPQITFVGATRWGWYSTDAETPFPP